MEELTRCEKLAAFQRGLKDEDLLKSQILDPSTRFANIVVRTQRYMIGYSNRRDMAKKYHRGAK